MRLDREGGDRGAVVTPKNFSKGTNYAVGVNYCVEVIKLYYNHKDKNTNCKASKKHVTTLVAKRNFQYDCPDLMMTILGFYPEINCWQQYIQFS